MIAALIGLVSMASAPPAAAHSFLVSVDPDNGAHLLEAPREIAFTFNEDIEPGFATVTVAVDGRQAYEVRTRVEGQVVVAEIPAQPVGPVDGTQLWKVAYRVVSGDGHPIAGDLSYAVSLSELPATGTPKPSSSPTAEKPLTAARAIPVPFPWRSVLALSLLTIVSGVAVALAAHRRGRSAKP